MHGGDHRRTRLAVVGWRGGYDARYTCNLCRDHAHVGGGDKRILPSRNVTPHRVNRHIFMSKNDAREGLDFDIL